MAKTNHDKFFNLNEDYLYIHKTGVADTGFGLDNTTSLIENGFGLYSCANLQDEIGPLKSDFYRIALCLKGSLQVDIGVESFKHKKNTIHFNVPGRLFLMKNKSKNLQAYYLFFTAEFIEEILSEIDLVKKYPFLSYLNTPFFELSGKESKNIAGMLCAISDEINTGFSDMTTVIKLLIVQILIAAKRSYIRQAIDIKSENRNESQLVSKYKKMVAQNFIRLRSIKDYADKMSVSPNHLSKVVKQETGKTAGDFIDEMLIMEIKALLRYSELNISEIAYQLDFADTSHLSKFFKKFTSFAPLEYRKKFQ